MTALTGADDGILASRAGARAVLDALPVGFFLIGDDRRIVDANDQFLELVGFDRSAVLGTEAPFPFWPGEAADEMVEVMNALLRSRHSTVRERFYRHRDGRRIPVRCELSVFETVEHGAVLLAVIHDMSNQRHNALRAREAYRLARTSGWDYYPANDLIVHPPGFEGLTQVAEGGASVDLVADTLTPASRDRFRETLLAVAEGRRESAALEVELARPTDGVEWVSIRLMAVRNEPGGTVHRVSGISQDITERKRTEIELAGSEERLTQAQRVAKLGSFEVDFERERIRFTPEWFAVVGEALGALDQSFDEARSGVARKIADSRQSDEVQEAILAVYESGCSRRLEHDLLVAGVNRTFETRLEPLEGDGRRVGVRGVSQDVTERLESTRLLRLQAHLLDTVDVSIITADAEGVITSWNAGAARLHGWAATDMLGKHVSAILPDDGVERLDAEIMPALANAGDWAGELAVRHRNGEAVPAFVRSGVLTDEQDEPIGMVAIGLDMTHAHERERELRSARDHLRALTNAVGEGLIGVDEDGRLLYMNRVAEELLGWSESELMGRVLHEVIHHRRSDGTPLAREDCSLVAASREDQTITAHDENFVRRDGSDLPVVLTTSPFETTDGLRGAVIVFRDNSARRQEEERWRRQMEQLAWAGRIRAALDHDRFVLHAQPIIDLETGETVQRELLLRMVGEEGQVIAPGTFLPAAEEYDLILEIDRWVVRQAVEIAAGGLPVEFNLSARSLTARGLIGEFRRDLERTKADPSLLVIELTETALIDEHDGASRFIEQIQALGCQVAMDDFGTGYGGFTYLKRLPVDYLKIDREFVRDLRTNEASQHVVRAVINLAEGFGQKTVAEGVEDADTLELLRELGVDYAQGFHIARPAPLD